MEEEQKHPLDAFETVWLRVTGRDDPVQSPQAPDESALYRRFIHEAYCAAQFYTNLARLFPSSGRGVLLTHAQECKARCRLLRAEYFIRSGEMYNPSEPCPLVGGKLASLRNALYRAQEQAARFRQTTQSAVDEPLRTLCVRYAEEAERHAQADRALLLDCF